MSSQEPNNRDYGPSSHPSTFPVDEATHQPQAHEIRSSGPANATEARNTTRWENMGENPPLQNENEDAVEQMETLAEGDVAHAVQRKSGTQKVPGGSPDPLLSLLGSHASVVIQITSGGGGYGLVLTI
ncbi:hypothetical protein ACRALDRAFT_2028074 [Sodiomyces alcalophilus JCM 7366]|uniref:uncharacterized protein n=1 Tax=Sodiomyces alcalophilus JCM 7366 TaxID=591952 RepID=UPI0039B3F76D